MRYQTFDEFQETLIEYKYNDKRCCMDIFEVWELNTKRLEIMNKAHIINSNEHMRLQEANNVLLENACIELYKQGRKIIESVEEDE